MSGKWERTFEVSVPVERVWKAFTDPDELRALFTPPGEEGVGADPTASLRVVEADPERLLRWVQERGDLPERAEFTVVFESKEHGSRITVTRCGFGEGEEADVFSEANALGWEHGLRDLVLYLETGRLVKRHYESCGLSSTGLLYAETDAGLQVRDVKPGGFGADAGLRRGDRLVRLGGAPVYARSDLWVLLCTHPAGAELEVEFVRGREVQRARAKLSTLDDRAWGE